MIDNIRKFSILVLFAIGLALFPYRFELLEWHALPVMAENGSDEQFLPVVMKTLPPPPGRIVFVPSGEFQMGCDPAQNGGFGCYYWYELPLHKVYLDDFYIDTYEVTNDQYAQFLNGREDSGCGGFECINPSAPESHISRQGELYIVDTGYENHPVVEVSWYGSNSYCVENGRRLPTEAEWEKAARGTTIRAYPWGSQTQSCSLANGNNCVGDTTEVGSYPVGASPYGALDMAGNVLEWVNDWWYDGDYYSLSPYANPPGPPTGTYKMMRGGSWFNGWDSLRVARRRYFIPENTYINIGFRCASDSRE